MNPIHASIKGLLYVLSGNLYIHRTRGLELIMRQLLYDWNASLYSLEHSISVAGRTVLAAIVANLTTPLTFSRTDSSSKMILILNLSFLLGQPLVVEPVAILVLDLDDVSIIFVTSYDCLMDATNGLDSTHSNWWVGILGEHKTGWIKIGRLYMHSHQRLTFLVAPLPTQPWAIA
jgi:hypothetical protein